MSAQKRMIEDMKKQAEAMRQQVRVLGAAAMVRNGELAHSKSLVYHLDRIANQQRAELIKLAGFAARIEDAELHDEFVSMLISMGLDQADEDVLIADREMLEWMLEEREAGYYDEFDYDEVMRQVFVEGRTEYVRPARTTLTPEGKEELERYLPSWYRPE